MRVSHDANSQNVRMEPIVREEASDTSSSEHQQSRHQMNSDDGVVTLPVTEKKVPRWLQGRRKTIGLKVLNWINGPSPRRLSIKPLFPRIQQWPTTFVSKILRVSWSEQLVVLLLVIIWIIAFTVINVNSIRAELVPGFNSVTKLPCTARLWPSSQACGVNGTNCQPFDGGDFAFSCPAGCSHGMVLEPHVLGNRQVNYQAWIIGGPHEVDGQASNLYRGDSFICGAALHAGIVSDSTGGCGILRRAGEQGNFTASSSNGLPSLSSEPRFPLSFSILPGSSSCESPEWRLFALSVVITVAIAIFTTSPATFYIPTFAIMFFQVGLASDAPFSSRFESAVSTAMARFIPAAAVGFLIYRFCVQRTLKDLQVPVEKAILWTGGCWVSAINRYTFDQIPLSRLTAHDIKQQPGAITALVVIVVILLLAAVGQVWALRVEGRLLKYIRLYAIVGVLLGLLSALPGLTLRLHHYIIAILLLPGTAVQTRPSLLYQGVLVGLFINGIARWDFASIVQTPGELRGGALLNSVLPYIATPLFSSSILNTNNNTIIGNLTGSTINDDTVTFTIPMSLGGYTGISMLVNDVERFQVSNFTFPGNITWRRSHPDEPTFFRFAFMAASSLGGLIYGDYTYAGTWWANGTWVDVTNVPFRTGYSG